MTGNFLRANAGKALLALGVTICAATAALAATTDDGFMVSKDGKMGIVTRPAGKSVPFNQDDAGLLTIFSNLATDNPKGVYWCCQGYFVTGPNNPFGRDAFKFAGRFHSDTPHTLNKIEVGAATEAGTNALNISLYSNHKVDDGFGNKQDAPNKLIKSWPATNLPQFGLCCAVTAVTDKAGVALAANTEYWIVLETDANSDTVSIWTQGVYNQTKAYGYASYCSDDVSGDGGCGTLNDVWNPQIDVQIIPTIGFAVLGNN